MAVAWRPSVAIDFPSSEFGVTVAERVNCYAAYGIQPSLLQSILIYFALCDNLAVLYDVLGCCGWFLALSSIHNLGESQQRV